MSCRAHRDNSAGVRNTGVAGRNNPEGIRVAAQRLPVHESRFPSPVILNLIQDLILEKTRFWIRHFQN